MGNRDVTHRVSPILFALDNTHFLMVSVCDRTSLQTPGMSLGVWKEPRGIHTQSQVFPLPSFLPSLSPTSSLFSTPFCLLSLLPSSCPSFLLPEIPSSSLFPSAQEIQNPHTTRHQPQTQLARLGAQPVPDQWGVIAEGQHVVCDPRLRGAPECQHPGNGQQGHGGQ